MILKYFVYAIHFVYGQMNEQLQAEIVAFWIKNNAIEDVAEAWRRTSEVVCVIRNPAGEIVGISSVYVGNLNDNEKHYYYRMFIQPGDRVYGMMIFVARATRDFLEDLAVPDKPQGLIIVTENAKLMMEAIRREFEEEGYVLIGKTAQGLDVWKKDFAPLTGNALPKPPREEPA